MDKISDQTVRRVMSAMGKRSAAKRLESTTPEQLSRWGKATVAARWAKERARKAAGGNESAT